MQDWVSRDRGYCMHVTFLLNVFVDEDMREGVDCTCLNGW